MVAKSNIRSAETIFIKIMMKDAALNNDICTWLYTVMLNEDKTTRHVRSDKKYVKPDSWSSGTCGFRQKHFVDWI